MALAPARRWGLTARGSVRWLAPALLVGATLALALTRIDDPDTWTHLALGREIVARRGLPTHEPLVFPSSAMPFYDTEWLFDAVLYLAWLAGGAAGAIVLVAVVVALAVLILWRHSRLGGAASPPGAASALAVLLPALVVLRPRMVERPDVALMAFLAFTAYALEAWLAEGRRLVWALPGVMIVWANVHPSMVVGLWLFAALLVGGAILRVLARRGWALGAPVPARGRLRVVAIVLAACLVAALVNPYGPDALTQPFRLYDMPWFRLEVGELQPPRFVEQPAPFVLTAVLALALALDWRRLPVVETLLVAPFVGLAFAAGRFGFLLALVGAPIVARTLDRLVADWTAPRTGGRARRLVGGALVAAVWATVLVGAGTVALAVAGVAPLADPRKVSGLGVNERYVPEGALRYLDRNGVTGRVFNVFHLGGYIAWRDLPRRAPIVDGRGWVPPGLMEEIHFARAYPEALERLVERWGLDVAVVDYPSYAGAGVEDVVGPDADRGLTSREWALVYWDDMALVYVRRAGRWAALIERDGYRWVRPANGTGQFARLAGDARAVAGARAELRRNLAETGSARAELLAGWLALETGEADEAVAAFDRVRDPRLRLEVANGLAQVAWRKGDWPRAIAHYKAILAERESAPLLYNIGLAYARAGDWSRAARWLERARARDVLFAALYPALVESYRRLGDAAAEASLGPDFLRAATRARVDEHLRRAGASQASGRLREAEAELDTALRLAPGDARVVTAIGELRLTEGRFEEALTALRSALKLDPGLARAHYGMGLVYLRAGDPGRARAHLEDYVRLEPRSYAAWQAREALRRPAPEGDRQRAAPLANP